jgi:hypothetical protein
MNRSHDWMPGPLWLLLAGVGLTAASVGACGAADAAAEFAGAPGERGADATSSGGAGAPAVPAPEREVEPDSEAPVATGNFIWIANPKSGRVALVDARTLEVRTVEAGNGPTYLATVPGQAEDTTIVANVLSSDATLLKVTPQGITTKTFRTATGANAWAFSADGRYAIAWTDARKVPGASRQQGFQDLAILDLAAGTSTILAVGYRPVKVGFAAQGATAHAITQDGIAIIDLSSAPRVSKNIAVSSNPLEDPGSRDVSVTPSGSHALIRRDDSSAVTIVALADGARADATLTGSVTDLDLSPAGDRAVAVVRDKSDVSVLPVPGLLAAPTQFSTVTVTGETIGSVVLANGGATGLLFSNGTPVERLTVMDLTKQPATYRTVRVYSPVLGAFPSPDGLHAVVLHDRTDGPDGSPGAFSLVPTGAEPLPAKIVATQAPMVAVGKTPPPQVVVANDRAVVTERDDTKQIYGVYLTRLPQLMVERFPLASPPIAAGLVPAAKRAFIAQQHPEGRITFLDLETGVARTLTGFELGARVVDGSKP